MDEFPLVSPGVRRLTVNLDHEDVALFEGLWPLPHGVALHAYLVEGCVLIDPWDAGGYGVEEVGADLETLGLGWGSIRAVAFTKAPSADLVARLQAARPGLEVWGTPTPGARHDLGSGAVLEAQDGWWVHLPSRTVFTGDDFSGLGWVEDEVWTEDLGEHDARFFEEEALRWFSARPSVPSLPPDVRAVAPAHGCLWKTPEAALAQVRRFQAWGSAGLDEVTVVWPSADTEGADALVGGVMDCGVGLNLFRVPGDDPTALAAGARRAALVVVGPGLDEGFLRGLDKEVWRPQGLSPAALRQGVADLWKSLD